MKLGTNPPRRQKAYKRQFDYNNYLINWDGSLYYVQVNDGRFHGYPTIQDAHAYIETLPFRSELHEDE